MVSSLADCFATPDEDKVALRRGLDIRSLPMSKYLDKDSITWEGDRNRQPPQLNRSNKIILNRGRAELNEKRNTAGGMSEVKMRKNGGQGYQLTTIPDDPLTRSKIENPMGERAGGSVQKERMGQESANVVSAPRPIPERGYLATRRQPNSARSRKHLEMELDPSYDENRSCR
ncbi:uncharacterized protein DFL_005770 [Arthrobotrys flagrans]|uniref:Uncharacterized protein n=1 Tax=Arthrobotrys flagrans TaxID=97331 RepID=A0A436ZZ58_ARTFL|nr:hypothetical protein DFL_005770 [Arthrobotrys flagrans]